MIVSVQWLSTLLGQELDPVEVSDRLAMLGAPVDAVETVHAELAPIVIAQVDDVQKHPDADRLTLCRVSTGNEVLDVVCGAPNVTAGKKYPYAPVGTVLPGGLELKRRKIRGIYSNGMLCSAAELELGADQDGILELDTGAAPGTPFLEALGMRDTRIEIDVTPNRPDLLCHKGVARDLGAVLGLPVKLDAIPGAPDETRAPVRAESTGSSDGIDVTIEADSGCHRYVAAVIRGVKVAPSPAWLDRRLRAVGQRPINNVVDATNYVLQELNQPLHAFDLAKLRDGKIVVRAARAGERLTTLDEQERAPETGTTLICDGQGPVALGGIMGGANSEVSDETTDIVLEAAYFDPRRIRRSRTALKMSTEASYRFERGVDHQAIPEAVRRAVALIIATAGGEEQDAPVDVYPKPLTTPTVFLRPSRVARLLGVDVGRNEIERILTNLGFAVAPKDDRLAVQAPGWRPDVAREEDLVEEVARIHGYDAFEPQLAPIRPSNVPNDPMERQKGQIRRVMTGLGLHEARSSSLGPETGERAQPLLNPLSAEEGFLRTDLMSGLVRSVEHNWSVRERGVRLFEIGTVFRAQCTGGLPKESLRLAAVITGPNQPPHWSVAGKAVDFDRWDVKSLMMEACRLCGQSAQLVADGERWVVQGEDGTVAGWAGPVEADAPAWAAAVFGMEVDVSARDFPPVTVTSMPDTPPIERDLALVLPAAVAASDVEDVVQRYGGDHLESATVFDEYRGSDLAGRGVAWRLVFRAVGRTMRDKEVDKTVKRLLATLKERLGVERREA